MLPSQRPRHITVGDKARRRRDVAEGEVAVDSIGAQAISRAQLELNFNCLPST